MTPTLRNEGVNEENVKSSRGEWNSSSTRRRFYLGRREEREKVESNVNGECRAQ
jgi:hypothetical protein